ncbi:MAG: AAA family ATPase [Candidatus Komeilibacteria bacterium]|nr:AAA family ATPase [Candidatus Komeilibacteria bacterium]
MSNKFVWLVGMCGAGKSEVAKYFTDQGFSYIRFGQITLDEVARRGLEANEANERPIREEFREVHGPAAYAILNIPKFDAALQQGSVLGDGLYSWSEYKFLKDKYGDTMVVVAVYASPATRYARLDGRAQRHGEDPKKLYRSFSPAEARSRDFAEIEKIEKAGPIAMADFTIVNEGTIVELKLKITEVYNKIIA